jgi:hypothetical protein
MTTYQYDSMNYLQFQIAINTDAIPEKMAMMNEAIAEMTVLIA